MSTNELNNLARDLKKQLPDVAAVFTKETTTRRFTVQ